MKRIVLTAVLVILPLSFAHADECLDKASSQTDMNECARKAHAASDGELNEIYRQIEHRLRDDTDSRKRLISAQHSWVVFRDAECQFEAGGVEGGSSHPMVSSMCLAKLTQHRVDDFKSFLSCQEGDLSCPVPPAK
jgi:uncharacterized protein YecT (DUF1311 family)